MHCTALHCTAVGEECNKLDLSAIEMKRKKLCNEEEGEALQYTLDEEEEPYLSKMIQLS